MSTTSESGTAPVIHFLSTNPNATADPSYLITSFGNQTVTFLKSIQRATRTLPTVSSTSFVQSNPSNPLTVTFTGLISNFGTAPISAMGVVYAPTTDPTIADDLYEYTPTLQNGSFSIGPSKDFGTDDVYARTYATNAFGTSYGLSLLLNIGLCLAKGTLITLSSGEKKAIEDITYDDLLRVWDFDQGEMSEAKPIWIMKVGKAKRYNLLTFSDGSTLKTINQHRIYNREKGEFTYPMTEDTPIGTSTYSESGEYITLESKQVVEEEVDYYNVITNYYINLFSDGILTSCHYSNIYKIMDMKYVKEDRHRVPQDAYLDQIPFQYYEGFRLAEQTIPIDTVIRHIALLESLKL